MDKQFSWATLFIGILSTLCVVIEGKDISMSSGSGRNYDSAYSDISTGDLDLTKETTTNLQGNAKSTKDLKTDESFSLGLGLGYSRFSLLGGLPYLGGFGYHSQFYNPYHYSLFAKPYIGGHYHHRHHYHHHHDGYGHHGGGYHYHGHHHHGHGHGGLYPYHGLSGGGFGFHAGIKF